MSYGLFRHFMPYCVDVERQEGKSLISLLSRQYSLVFKCETDLQLTMSDIATMSVSVERFGPGKVRFWLYKGSNDNKVGNPEGGGVNEMDKAERVVSYYIRLSRLLKIVNSVRPLPLSQYDAQE